MIAVTWYDARNSLANTTAQYFGAFSSDGGATFGRISRLVLVRPTRRTASQPSKQKPIMAITPATLSSMAGGAGFRADNSNSTGDNPDFATNFDVYTAMCRRRRYAAGRMQRHQCNDHIRQ